VELQNPHGLPSVSINKAPPKAAAEKAKPAQAKSAVTAIKAKEADPCVCGRGSRVTILNGSYRERFTVFKRQHRCISYLHLGRP
jgi:hypothetical protein